MPKSQQNALTWNLSSSYDHNRAILHPRFHHGWKMCQCDTVTMRSGIPIPKATINSYPYTVYTNIALKTLLRCRNDQAMGCVFITQTVLIARCVFRRNVPTIHAHKSRTHNVSIKQKPNVRSVRMIRGSTCDPKVKLGCHESVYSPWTTK